MFPRKKYYTPDEANYNLTAGLTDDMLGPYLAIALSKIPIKIADKVMTECFFAALRSGIYGQYFHDIKKKSLIIIDYRYLNRAKPERIEFTILHEIAHWFLKHGVVHGSGSEFRKIWKKQEKDADNQAKNWLIEWANADPVTKLDSNQWIAEYWKSKGISL